VIASNHRYVLDRFPQQQFALPSLVQAIDYMVNQVGMRQQYPVRACPA
jgi:hypothetical protein